MDGNRTNLGWSPCETINGGSQTPWLIICDHATNAVPPWINNGDLGLVTEDMHRHIAYDVGAAGMTRELARLLNAPAVLANFSRLVIDPNRGEDDPTLVMELYDGSIIPANRNLSRQDLDRRLNECYRAYHSAVAQAASKMDDPVIVSVHSFTPAFIGRPPRPWHVGLLHASDRRLTDPLFEELKAEGDLTVALNEPYTGFLRGDPIDRHAIETGRNNTLIEIRNDLIQDDQSQKAWAERFARMLPKALERIERKALADG